MATINNMLAYDPRIKITIEPKPNKPKDQAYIPASRHAITVAGMADESGWVGVNIESTHAILSGLDPSDEMGFALAFNKLFTVHLNDQNGLKFDQDKSFGSVDLLRAFNKVRILDQHDYGKNVEWVGLDVKAMRMQKFDVSTKHLSNSRTIFLLLLDLVRNLDQKELDELITRRDYKELELRIMDHLLGK